LAPFSIIMISDKLTPIAFEDADWPVQSHSDSSNAFNPGDFAPLPMTITFTPRSNPHCTSVRKSNLEISKYQMPLRLSNYSDLCKSSRRGFYQQGKSLWSFSFVLKIKRMQGFKIALRRIPCICMNLARCGLVCRCFANHVSERKARVSRFEKRPSSVHVSARSFAKGQIVMESQGSSKQSPLSMIQSRRFRLYRTGPATSIVHHSTMRADGYDLHNF